jgi:hypothetical protein
MTTNGGKLKAQIRPGRNGGWVFEIYKPGKALWINGQSPTFKTEKAAEVAAKQDIARRQQQGG